MSDATFIKKLQPDAEGLDFAGLRVLAIELVQSFAGDVWTDYNLHDPGVTIIESCCYVLTDLIYRCAFPTADYLTHVDGSIHFAEQGLYRPDEILPTRALTDNDYRKLMLSAVPNLDNIWVSHLQNDAGEAMGLFRFHVQLSDTVKHQENEGVRAAYAAMIQKVYSANRNLCEDLEQVHFVRRVPFALRGKIEIDGKREAVQVLADIYFACAQYLSPKVPIQSYDELYRNGKSLDELFCGVLTEQGYIDDADLYPWCGYFSIADLLNRIGQVRGVRYVPELVFVNEQDETLDHIFLEQTQQMIASLLLPSHDRDIQVTLFRAGKQYAVSARDLVAAFNRLDTRQQALRQNKQRFDWVASILPQGEYRDFSDYYPLQNHLPDTYGVNHFGVPDSESAQRKAQAAQLKAYLMFFEQVLANFLQNIQNIKRLYSLAEHLPQSYFYQCLHNDVVAQVETLYVKGGSQLEPNLAKTLQRFDSVDERRNRVLDYLLGMYGEKFNQNAIKHYFSEDVDVEQAKIANKLDFLKNIVDFNKNRAAAVDYRYDEDALQNCAGLQKKLRLLLGETVAEVQLVEHILLRPNDMQAWSDFYPHRLSVLFQETRHHQEFCKLAEETVYLNCPAHVYPEIFWLDEAKWQTYQTHRLDKAWLYQFLLTLRGEDE